MNTLMRRLRKLEEDRAAQRNPQGLTLVDVLRHAGERRRRRADRMRNCSAKVEMEAQASWESYTGDRSHALLLFRIVLLRW